MYKFAVKENNELNLYWSKPSRTGTIFIYNESNELIGMPSTISMEVVMSGKTPTEYFFAKGRETNIYFDKNLGVDVMEIL